MIRRLWKISWSIWAFRNHHAHSKASNWYQATDHQLQIKIRMEYAAGPQGAKGLHARWWRQPLLQIVQLEVESKIKWLESVLGVRARQRETNYSLVRQQRMMRAWLKAS